MDNRIGLDPVVLAETALLAQRDLCFRFDLTDVYELGQKAVREANDKGLGAGYIPALFRKNLVDFAAHKRAEAELKRRNEKCVQFAEAYPA